MWQEAINKASSVSSALIRVRDSSERDTEGFWEKRSRWVQPGNSTQSGSPRFGNSYAGDEKSGIKGLRLEICSKDPGSWGSNEWGTPGPKG